MNKSNSTIGHPIYFRNLDGLRTIAFLLVYIQHGLWNSFEMLGIKPGFLHSLIFGVANGSTGVSIFFVLSGFLITYLLLKEQRDTGKIKLWNFYMRRVLRIWPLYFAVITFAFLLYPFLKFLLGIQSHQLSNPFYYFTFLSNFDLITTQHLSRGEGAMMEGITWSVAVEEQYYIIWPLLFLMMPKRSYKWIFLTVVTICLTFRFFHKNDGIAIYFHTLSVCADLAVGGICAYYVLYAKKFKNFFLSLEKIEILFIYLIGFGWMLYGTSFLTDTANLLLFRLVSTLFFAFIILEQNFSTQSFYKFSNSNFLTFWGKYTYGLYLLHPIALLILDVSLRILHVPYKESFLSLFITGISALGISLLLSYVSYEYYEKPFLRWKKRFSTFKRSDIKITQPVLQEEDVIS